MATFPSIDPDYGAQKNSAPNVHKVQFGDGYENRMTYGLNQNPKVWTLSFVNLTETDADTIETFLDARAADNASFDWSPPDDEHIQMGMRDMEQVNSIRKSRHNPNNLSSSL